MKQWVIIVLVATAIVIVIGIFQRWPFRQPNLQSVASKKYSGAERVPAASNPSDKTTNKSVLSGLVVDEETKAQILEGHQEALNSNVPIEFYGKVIDQNGVGVPGVKVRAYVSSYDESFIFHLKTAQVGDEQKKVQVEVITASDGLFCIKNMKGRILHLTDFSKEGYRSLSEDNGSFVYDPSLQNLFHPDAQRPIILHMWKSGPTEPLIKAEKNYSIEANGSVYTIDLLKRKIVMGNAAQGDLRVQVKRPTQISRKAPYQWSFTVDAVDGGIVETNDIFPLQAPSSGYESGYEYVMDPSQSKWADALKKRFYIRTRGGKLYASMDILVSNYDDDAYIETKYFANPAGSRNLEFDPAKKIE